MTTKIHWLFSIVLSVLLIGCGGGADPQAHSPAGAVAVLRSQWRAMAAGAGPAAAAEQLFDFAEAAYPAYFPGHQATASWPPFAYRYYPDTGVYLGLVVNHDTSAVPDSVYAMGGPFGNTPALVGPMTDYLVRIKGSINGYAFASGLVLELASEAPAGGSPVSESLAVPSSTGSFEFGTLVPVGAHYTVSVQRQPIAILNGGERIAPLVCSVAGGEGVASSGAAPVMSITCEQGYTIGGTISWTPPPAAPGGASGLVLGSGALTASPVPGATSFTLSPAVVSGTPYDVAVQAQPAGYTCAVANGAGTVPYAMSALRVSCVANVDLSILASQGDAGSTSKDGFTLNLVIRDFSVPRFTVNQIRDTFLAAYPAMVARFNPGAATQVSVVIDPDPAYPYPSYTLGTTITMSSAWLKLHPMDIDMVVHESFHISQAYPAGAPTPSWITEGLADYARDRYGMWNAAAGWTLAAPGASDSYTDGYRTTARFFEWVEANYGDFLAALDADMRAGLYTASFWTRHTGRTVDQLWAAYQAVPGSLIALSPLHRAGPPAPQRAMNDRK